MSVGIEFLCGGGSAVGWTGCSGFGLSVQFPAGVGVVVVLTVGVSLGCQYSIIFVWGACVSTRPSTQSWKCIVVYSLFFLCLQSMVDGQPNLLETMDLFGHWLAQENLLSPIEGTASSDLLSAATASTGAANNNTTSNPSGLHHSALRDDVAFVTCGDWDIKSCLVGQCHHLNVPIPPIFHRWINLKKPFFKQTKTWPKGMMHMLEVLDITTRRTSS